MAVAVLQVFARYLAERYVTVSPGRRSSRRLLAIRTFFVDDVERCVDDASWLLLVNMAPEPAPCDAEFQKFLAEGMVVVEPVFRRCV